MSVCVSIQTWAAYLIAVALILGVLIGSFIRLGLDRAELAAYRLVVRSSLSEGQDPHR